MTDRLGETFIAARLRHTVLHTACPSEPGVAAEPRWSWPWDEQGLAGGLPPRFVADHATWSVRCGDAGPRERCALVQRGALRTDGGVGATSAGAEAIGFSTHFVIDTIGDEERIIWRLYLHHHDDARGRVVEWNVPRGSVVVRADNTEATAPFSVCTRAGCLLELDVRTSAELVNRLWDGAALSLTVVPPARANTSAVGITTGAAGPDASVVFTGEVSAIGMRRALPQLTLLRQREMRPARDAATRPDAGRSLPVVDMNKENGR